MIALELGNIRGSESKNYMGSSAQNHAVVMDWNSAPAESGASSASHKWQMIFSSFPAITGKLLGNLNLMPQLILRKRRKHFK